MNDLNKFKEILSIFESFQKISNLGHWVWNLENGNIYWSDEACNILNFKNKPQEITFDDYLLNIPKDERTKVMNHIDNTIKNADSYELTHNYKVSNKNKLIKAIGKAVKVA